MFYSYILKSKKDSDLYIGSTNNLKERFKKHNSGKVFSTKARRPMEIIYYEAYKS
jgi:putative endonuclease